VEPDTTKISAVVLTYNEEKQIRDCLETIKWVDEIVVCDSFSTDKTVEICREYTDKIFQRTFDNFGNQKNWTLDKPSHEWVLFVEADERFPPELGDEIRKKLGINDQYDGYWMPFENYIFGRKMKGTFWVFKKLKLYKKHKGIWQDRKVHSKFIFEGKAGELENPVRHYPYANLQTWFVKFSRSTTLEADERIRNNVHLKWYDLIKGCAWVPVTFWRCYISFGDWRNGMQGLVMSLLTSPYNLVVYLKHFKKNRFIQSF
jgi:glycosyltransferase involved in cell wall biosynthesis